jgi:hypothetical protein
MPSGTNFKVIVLFEDEVRIAAKAIHEFFSLNKNAEISDAEFQRLGTNAIHACMVALSGAHEDENVLLLGRKPCEPINYIKSEVVKPSNE